MTVLEYEPSVLVVLGGAFAVCYWSADAVAVATPAVGRAPLLALGVAMAVGWPVFAGYLSSVTPHEGDPVRRTAERVALWVVAFGGTAVVVTWAIGAVLGFLWPAGMATTFWFGMVVVSTTALGAATVAGWSVYRQLASDVGFRS